LGFRIKKGKRGGRAEGVEKNLGTQNLGGGGGLRGME